MAADVILKITTDTAGFYYRLDAGAVVDNVFSFVDSDGNKVKIVDNLGQYVARLGGVLPGSNMLARLQTILNHAAVKNVLFDEGDITITGALNCNGKKISFANNSKLIGVHTLNNGILDCDIRTQCFTVNTTLTNFSSVRTEFSFENYGALGAGADETAVLQKTADTIIANTKMPRTIKLVPNKNYATQGLVLHNWDGVKYNQYTIAIRGEVNTMGGNPSFTSSMTLLNPNGFLIGVQRATGFYIGGVNLNGPGNIPAVVNSAEFFSRPYATFASDGGVRDSGQSPCALINIDPFRNTNTLPADGGYPDYNGTVTALNPAGINWYRGPGGADTTGGSTAGIIRDFSVQGAAVGVAVGINGETQQCENMLIENVLGNNLKTVTAWGQRESKGCHLKMGYSYDRVYNIIDGDSYGAHQGTLPNVDGYTCSGNVVQFISGSAQHPLSITNVYTETNFRIGDLISRVGMAQFISCVFNFATGPAPLLIPKFHFGGQNVHFEGCVIRYYDDLFNKRAIFQGFGITAHKTFFDLPPLGTSGTSYPGEQKMMTIDCVNCHYGDGGLFGYGILKGYFQTRVDYSIGSGKITIENNAESIYGRMLQEYQCGAFDKINAIFAAFTFTVDAAAKTAVLNSPTADLLIGQYILYFPPASAVLQVLGRVSSINYSTSVANLVDVPVGVPNGAGSGAFMAVSDYQRFSGRWTGVYSFNSTTVTNVFGDPVVGTYDRYTGAVILAYNAGAKTVTLSRGALNTANISPELYNPASPFGTEKITYTSIYLPTDAGVANDATKYFPGDVWIHYPSYYGGTPAIAGVRKFQCTRSGYLSPATIGQTKKSLWVELLDDTGLNTKEFTTTDAIPVTVETIPFNSNYETVTIEAEIISKDAAAVGGYYSKKSQSFDYTTGTGASQYGSTVDIVADKYIGTLSAASFVIALSGGNIIIQFTGEAGINIQSRLRYTITRKTI